MNWSRSNFFLIILVFAIFVVSCRDEPELIATTLEITVLDDMGSPVQDADVSLYTTLDSWLTETGQVLSLEKSDSAGKVMFVNIDTGVYYIDIQKNTLNNWESGAKKTVFANLVNSSDIEITESNSGLLSSAAGKKWTLTGYKRNQVDLYNFLEDCEKDSERIFYKGPTLGEVTLTTGELKCEESEPGEQDGFWSFSPDQKNIDIDLSFDTFRWTIEELTESTFRYNYIDENTGFVIEETYTAE